MAIIYLLDILMVYYIITFGLFRIMMFFWGCCFIVFIHCGMIYSFYVARIEESDHYNSSKNSLESTV